MKRLLLIVLLATGTLASAQLVPKPLTFRATAASAEMPDPPLLGPFTELFQTLGRPKPFSVVANTDMPEPAALNLTFTPAKTAEAVPFHKRIFIAEVVAYTVPNILDGVTTVRVVRRGFTEEPFPWGSAELLGTRPGIARYTLIMGGVQAAVTFASYKLEHSRSRKLRLLGHSLMVNRSVVHTVCFVSNLRLGPTP